MGFLKVIGYTGKQTGQDRQTDREIVMQRNSHAQK